MRGSSARMSRSVLAIFGPTARGKSAVAEAIAERDPGPRSSRPTRCRSTTASRSSPTSRRRAARRGSGRSSTRPRSASTRSSPTPRSTRPRRRRRRPSSSAGPGSTSAPRSPSSTCRPAPEPGARERWEELYDETGRGGGARGARRARPGGRGRRPPERPPPRRARARARRGRASLRRARPSVGGRSARHPTLVVGLESRPRARAADRRADARDVRRRRRDEVRRRARRRRSSSTARKMIGLREVAELPRGGDRGDVARADAQYAAYQRKWMRRIPGLVTVPADRPPGEVADEILAVARGSATTTAGRAG